MSFTIVCIDKYFSNRLIFEISQVYYYRRQQNNKRKYQERWHAIEHLEEWLASVQSPLKTPTVTLSFRSKHDTNKDENFSASPKSFPFSPLSHHSERDNTIKVYDSSNYNVIKNLEESSNNGPDEVDVTSTGTLLSRQDGSNQSYDDDAVENTLQDFDFDLEAEQVLSDEVVNPHTSSSFSSDYVASKSNFSIMLAFNLIIFSVYAPSVASSVIHQITNSTMTPNHNPDDDIETNETQWTWTFGLIAGYLSSLLYIASRIPQLWKNFSNKSCEVNFYCCIQL